MDNRKYLIDKYSNGKEVKDPNFRQYFTFDELVDLLDSYQTEQLILSGVVVPKGTLVCDECNGEPYEEQGSLYECTKCESTNSD